MLPLYYFCCGMMRLMKKKSESIVSRQGFTLIELAIVLVIVGLLVGLGSSMVGVLTTAINVRQTKESMDAVTQSVISWASANNTLPDAAGFTSVAKTPNDAWGRPFVYLYDANLFNASPTKDTICGRRSTSITLNTLDPTALTTINNVAFIILSASDDAAVDATLAAGATLNGVAAVPAIPMGTMKSLNGTFNIDAKNSDIVRWVTLDELRSKIGCQGAPLKIVNNELPFGATPTPYSVTISADGGVPFAPSPPTYKWCVNNNLPSGFLVTGGIQNANCLAIDETFWGAAASGLTISFPVSVVPTGSYQITVVARDNADGVTTSGAACNSATPTDNCAQKMFVLTVNPN